MVKANAYRTDGPWQRRIRAQESALKAWSLVDSHDWYDFTASAKDFSRGFAGRLETGADSVSDPAVLKRILRTDPII